MLQQAVVVCLGLVHVLYQAPGTASQRAAFPFPRRQTPQDQPVVAADVEVGQPGHLTTIRDGLQDERQRKFTNYFLKAIVAVCNSLSLSWLQALKNWQTSKTPTKYICVKQVSV